MHVRPEVVWLSVRLDDGRAKENEVGLCEVDHVLWMDADVGRAVWTLVLVNHTQRVANLVRYNTLHTMPAYSQRWKLLITLNSEL